MTPYQLAKESESSQQMALFCYCAKAEVIGFNLAKQKASYESGNVEILKQAGVVYPVPELAFFHHIPNGGSRGDSARSAAIAGGKLKAEGVKAGVLDCFWPLRRYFKEDFATTMFSGLYIEMKRSSLKRENDVRAGCSKDQIEFGEFVLSQGYMVVTCYDWLEAAQCLQDYYGLEK